MSDRSMSSGLDFGVCLLISGLLPHANGIFDASGFKIIGYAIIKRIELRSFIWLLVATLRTLAAKDTQYVTLCYIKRSKRKAAQQLGLRLPSFSVLQWRGQKLASLKQFGPLVHSKTLLSAALQWDLKNQKYALQEFIKAGS
ncbi:MAG: hypothetical protein GY868_21040, partial [Deltaproteobacteria bacterium]|nr:hypothetical protein [Deltaproteobacteria bacterium]